MRFSCLLQIWGSILHNTNKSSVWQPWVSETKWDWPHEIIDLVDRAMDYMELRSATQRGRERHLNDRGCSTVISACGSLGLLVMLEMVTVSRYTNGESNPHGTIYIFPRFLAVSGLAGSSLITLYTSIFSSLSVKYRMGRESGRVLVGEPGKAANGRTATTMAMIPSISMSHCQPQYCGYRVPNGRIADATRPEALLRGCCRDNRWQ